MPEIPVLSQITLPNGTVYNLKDAKARADIEAIQAAISGGLKFIGETTTPLTDGSTTNPIEINGSLVTAHSGNIVLYGQKEFLFDGTQWLEMGDLSLLGALAYKDSASGSYTPAGVVSQPTFTGSASAVSVSTADSESGNYQPKGTVSQPTFTGNASSSSGVFTPEGTVSVSASSTENKSATVQPAAEGAATYTPAGSVTAPEISISSAGSTTTVNSITDVGSLPSFSATVTDENLTLGFSAGTLPTKGADTTVKTTDASYSASTPAFTGTGVRLVTGNIPVPSAFSASFSGTEGSVSVSGTPSGTVSQPTFTGTKTQISGSVTPNGTVSQPTFSGTAATITVS